MFENYERKRILFRYMFEKVDGHIVPKRLTRHFSPFSFLLFTISTFFRFKISSFPRVGKMKGFNGYMVFCSCYFEDKLEKKTSTSTEYAAIKN